MATYGRSVYGYSLYHPTPAHLGQEEIGGMIRTLDATVETDVVTTTVEDVVFALGRQAGAENTIAVMKRMGDESL